MVSSELAPFAKTGGLGDVAGALPRYLDAAGHHVRPFLPLYGSIDQGGLRFSPVTFAQDVPLRMGGRNLAFTLYTAPLPGGGPEVYFVSCPALYAGRGIYAADGDEHLRFAFLAAAAIESCQRMGWSPQVFHGHDWHAALLPLLLKTVYGWDSLFHGTRTVLTIHNLGYQGVFPASALRDVGLVGAEEHHDREDLRQGRFGFLKTGLLHADAVTAVSRTYAKEIQGEELGMGLDPWLRARRRSVTGIVNGIDTRVWSPETDDLLPARYSAQDLSGKAACRDALLDAFDLAPAPEGPVLGVVSRLPAQKGFDLLFETLPPILEREDCRLAVLGSGEERYAEFFGGMQRRFPGKACYRSGYDERGAHLVEAGSDVFLMPSRFEPCGLNQMYSQRYGTVPVVRKTGGLADTVKQFDPRANEGTGFVFDHFTPTGMRWALDVALRTWKDRDAWAGLVRRGMAEDFSWERRIGEYVALYEGLQ
jgi:starch synthase